MPHEKSCHDCRNIRREQTGPHAYAHHCALHQVDFPHADQCAAYLPGPDPLDDEGEYWPMRGGWEVTQ